MKKTVLSFLVFILFHTGSWSAEDGRFHLSLGGTAWYSEWDGDYDRDVQREVFSYDSERRTNYGGFMSAVYRRWVLGMEAFFFENKGVFDLIPDEWDGWLNYKSTRDDYAFIFGYVFFENPYVTPFVKYRRIDINSDVLPFRMDCYGGSLYWLDHRISTWEAGIEAVYALGSSGFAVEYQIAMSVLGEYEVKIKEWCDYYCYFYHRYHSDDVEVVDWKAGISYCLPEYHLKMAAGYKQSYERIDYERPDVNFAWNPRIYSDISGPFFSISFEL